MSTTKIATEAHPLKRARLDTDETGLNHCTHHPTFFLPDGNVVLVCEAILFRTYKGLLSRHSEIFWDMFSLSSHQPADAEVYDGCPVVRLQDTAQDFTYLMSAMLDTHLLFPGKQILFDQLAAVLRLSAKYNAPGIRSVVVSRLKEIYPPTMAENESFFDSSHKNTRFMSFLNPHPHPNEIVKLLQEFNLLAFLPVACYEACTGGIQSFLSQEAKARLPPDVQRTMMIGAVALHSAEVHLYSAVFATGPECKCHAPVEIAEHRAMHLVSLATDEIDVDLFNPMNPIAACEGTQFCLRCAKRWAKIDREERMKFWDVLPAMFGLPPWEELLVSEED